jgi:hypothetical protein
MTHAATVVVQTAHKASAVQTKTAKTNPPVPKNRVKNAPDRSVRC